ncbi:MAG: preprotein translocase subunit SecE [Pseudomonadales bacterium]|nr:preprotein translocase subunit SecE [Pseudomonadales bacterium]
MSTGTDTTAGSTLDWLKWLVVAAILGGGVYANWYYGEESLLLRVVGLLVLATVAGFVSLQTERGRSTWSLIKEARSEIRRVVWPSNQETTQTTLVVLVLIVIFALILWGLDSLLGWIVSSIIG